MKHTIKLIIAFMIMFTSGVAALILGSIGVNVLPLGILVVLCAIVVVHDQREGPWWVFKVIAIHAYHLDDETTVWCNLWLFNWNAEIAWLMQQNAEENAYIDSLYVDIGGKKLQILGYSASTRCEEGKPTKTTKYRGILNWLFPRKNKLWKENM